MATWQISGEYMETCNCTFLCPCLPSNMNDTPTEGNCKVAIAMRIDEGHKGDVKLDGLAFFVLLYAPGAMAQGNMTVGLVVDDKATDPQVEAITAIATGQAGGPIAALAPLVGKVAGVERRPVGFEVQGLTRTSSAGELVDQACEGLPSGVDPQWPICLDNVAHPVSTRVALAKATRSRLDAFGIQWADETGRRNAHFAPFSWSG